MKKKSKLKQKFISRGHSIIISAGVQKTQNAESLKII